MRISTTNVAATIASLPMVEKLLVPKQPACVSWLIWLRRPLDRQNVHKTPFSVRLYRFLLKLYPAAFREEFSGLLELEYRDELAASRGTLAFIALWLRLL